MSAELSTTQRDDLATIAAMIIPVSPSQADQVSPAGGPWHVQLPWQHGTATGY